MVLNKTDQEEYKMKPQKVNMNNQLCAIKLLMVCLVIVIWLITPICYATDPEDLPWSNESDIIILPWSNETEILPPVTPEPITNETDVVIIVTDQDLASIQSQLYNIYDWMMTHDQLMMNSRSSIRELNATLNDTIVNFVGVVEDFAYKLLDSDAQLQGQIDTQGMVIDELRQEVAQVNEQIEYLENKISRLKNNILYTFIATAVILTTCIAFFIKKARA